MMFMYIFIYSSIIYSKSTLVAVWHGLFCVALHVCGTERGMIAYVLLVVLAEHNAACLTLLVIIMNAKRSYLLLG